MVSFDDINDFFKSLISFANSSLSFSKASIKFSNTTDFLNIDSRSRSFEFFSSLIVINFSFNNLIVCSKFDFSFNKPFDNDDDNSLSINLVFNEFLSIFSFSKHSSRTSKEDDSLLLLALVIFN